MFDSMKLKSKIDEHMKKIEDYYDICGLVVSASGPDFDYAHAAGFSDFAGKIRMHENDIFHMASLTKLFVGTSIMMLIERNLIELDAKLTDYLPWFTMKDERYKKITIRQLLSHTSGMHDVEDYFWDKPQIDEMALERYIRSEEITNGRLRYDPSEGKFSYSNIGYEILGLIISKVSEMSFEDFVKVNTFEPLKMNDSTLLTFERDILAICTPHSKDKENRITAEKYYPYSRTHGPSSTLTSNAKDIKNWAKAQLNKSLLKPESYDLMFSEQGIVPNNGERICLSWFKRQQSGYTLYGHECADVGFRASFWICPELGTHILVTANMSSAPAKKINKQIFDIMLGKQVAL